MTSIVKLSKPGNKFAHLKYEFTANTTTVENGRIVEGAKVDAAYKKLKYLTTSIHFKPNEQLIIPVLAKDFSISHTPVREALIRLHAEAIIKGEWHRGYFAFYPGLQEARDLYRILSTLMQDAVVKNGEAPGIKLDIEAATLLKRLEGLSPIIGSGSLYDWAIAIEHSLMHLLDIPPVGEARQVYHNLFDRTRCLRLVALCNNDFRIHYRDLLVEAVTAYRERDARPTLHLINRQFGNVGRRVPELVRELYWLASQR